MLGIAEFGATDPAVGYGPTVSIDMEYLGTLEVQLDPPQMIGQRMIFNTTGGTIKGPKIRGTIVDPSGDWLMPMPDGSLRLDVRATIKTAEGEFILMEYNGVTVAVPAAIAPSDVPASSAAARIKLLRNIYGPPVVNNVALCRAAEVYSLRSWYLL